jgi:hypothetical protein
MKNIGIFVSSGASLFYNGLQQNAYFIFCCIHFLGIPCCFIGDKQTNFGHKGLIIESFPKDLSNYILIIAASQLLSQAQYKLCVSYKIPVVDFICGNHFMTDLLLFTHGSSGNFHSNIVTADLGWVIPSLLFMKSYISMLRNYPMFLIPHLWSPELLIQRKKDIDINYKQRKYNKIAIVILEPNLNPLKTAVLPLAVAENVATKLFLEKVYVSSIPSNDEAKAFLKNITVSIEVLPRIELEKIIMKVYTDDVLPIFVCHHINNPLNYLYYEILHLGFPLIHNSLMLDDCGYFYDTFENACLQVLVAFQTHSYNYVNYVSKVKKYLEQIDPTKSASQKVLDLVNSITQVSL